MKHLIAIAIIASAAPAFAQEMPDCGQGAFPCIQREQPTTVYQSEVCGSVVHRNAQAIADVCHREYDGPQYSTASKEARKRSIEICERRESILDANGKGRP